MVSKVYVHCTVPLLLSALVFALVHHSLAFAVTLGSALAPALATTTPLTPTTTTTITTTLIYRTTTTTTTTTTLFAGEGQPRTQLLALRLPAPHTCSEVRQQTLQLRSHALAHTHTASEQCARSKRRERVRGSER